MMTRERLSRKLRTARTLLRDLGPARFLVLALQHLPGIGPRVRMVVVTRSHSIPSLPIPSNVTYRHLRPGERLPLDVFPPGGLESPEVRQARFAEAIARGSEGVVAEIDGRTVAYAWAAFHRHLIPGVRFTVALGADEACTYASYVVPAFRYSRVYGGLGRFLLTSLRDRGIRSFVGYASLISLNSIHAHRRLGYEIIGWVLLVQFPFVDLQVTRLDTDGQRRRWRWLSRQPGHLDGSGAIDAGNEGKVLTSYAPTLRGRTNG